ncbi:hypothetical protein [Streptomyces scabiei]|uniref:hypothetical protein n=1 Tax=Streptomyces scabiei TaxID=1930 RepID=UPI0038F64366
MKTTTMFRNIANPRRTTLAHLADAEDLRTPTRLFGVPARFKYAKRPARPALAWTVRLQPAQLRGASIPCASPGSPSTGT